MAVEDFLKTRQALHVAMTERELMDAAMAYLVHHGYLVYHDYDSRRNRAGLPDIISVHPTGTLIFCEVKKERGALRPAQIEWLEALQRVPGCTTLVLRPSTWDSLERAVWAR